MSSQPMVFQAVLTQTTDGIHTCLQSLLCHLVCHEANIIVTAVCERNEHFEVFLGLSQPSPSFFRLKDRTWFCSIPEVRVTRTASTIPCSVVTLPLQVATNANLVFFIFTNGESCFVVERSIFEMVDRFCRSS